MGLLFLLLVGGSEEEGQPAAEVQEPRNRRSTDVKKDPSHASR
jgi:hypothetical protein